jgi:hypothetical protein
MPLLVTLGSPLGMWTRIYDRIQPRPPDYPNAVHRWVNVADPNDLVAADPLGEVVSSDTFAQRKPRVRLAD